MYYPISPSLERKLGVLLLLCLVCAGLWAQKPVETTAKNLICGVPSKTHEAPSGTTAEDMVYDRFGNTYSMVEMAETAFFQNPINCEGAGDFILYLDDAGGIFTEKERNVICDVFTYLSSIIDAPSNEQAIIRFVKDSSLSASTAATGSPYFPNECGLGHSLVHRQLTTGGQPHIDHGFIEVNPIVSFYYEGYEGMTDITINEVDFYTVILHEALHVLGFGSQISTTGAPTQDFYTQWDLGLRASNGEPLILRTSASDGECCATYMFNPATNLSLPDDVLSQSCGSTTTYAVNAPAPIYGDYIGNSNAVFLNTLSHLNNDCTPGTDTDHVMHFRILPGQDGTQRTLSVAESEIMCSLGYETPDEGCAATPTCITLAANDGIYYIAQGETTNIPFVDLLANDFTNDIVPILVENCGLSSGLIVEQLEEGFQIDGSNLGRFSFCYTITDCEGKSCDVGNVTVVVTNPLIANTCAETDDCQINPYPDFNVFGSVEEMNFFLSDGNVRSDGLSTIRFSAEGPALQSLDFYPSGQANQFVCTNSCGTPLPTEFESNIDLVGTVTGFNSGRTFIEGIVIPLCEPVYPGMNISIELFAITPNSSCVNGQFGLQFDFSENPPVVPELIYDNPGMVMLPVVEPIDMSFDDVNINELTSDNKKSITIQNVSNSCINYLYISPSVDIDSVDFRSAYVLLGDIHVNINNSLTEILNLTASPNNNTPFIGEVIEIEISLENIAACAGTPFEYPSSTLNLELPQGLIHVPNNDFPQTNIFIDENELTPDATYTLEVRVDDPSLIGQPLTISGVMFTDDPCFDAAMSSEIATITPCTNQIHDFTVQAVDGECGVYNYFSDPSTVDNVHRWYLNEQTENAIFSMEVNPTNHILPDGVHTIIHVVEGSCGTEIFEVNLAPVSCGNFLFTCPCEGDDAINIEAGIGTPLSQLIANGEMPANGINNKCLAINGHLLIDQAAMGAGSIYEFLESEVRMQPGSSITVEAEAVLSINGNENGGVHGCFDLWKGISLAPGSGAGSSGISGGQLSLEGALIEDAVYAVKLSHKSTFEMVQTTLNRNHIGIYMPPSSGFQSVSQPTPPQKSIIKSTGALLDSYSGQDVQTGTTSYAGVEINDSKFQIGGGFSGRLLNLLGFSRDGFLRL